MMRWSAAALTAVALTSLLGCGSGSDNPAVAPSPSPSAVTGCHPAPTASPRHLSFGKEPPLTVAPTTYVATIVTNCGTIVASLDAAKAPHTVNAFVFLAGKHYFDNTTCHRLTTQGIHVLQCGDPTGTGGGGPGFTLPDENLTGAMYPAGTLAMANTGRPHSGGSQFFIVYGDTPLPPQYTPFGRVTRGLDVVQRVAAAGDDQSNGPGDGHPTQPIVIESFTVAR